MADNSGVWTNVNEMLDETSSQLSLVSPSQVAAASTPGASSTPHAVPRDHCFGQLICAWCMLGCTKEEHGHLDRALVRYHLAQTDTATRTSHLTVTQEMIMFSVYKHLLLVAAMQLSASGPTEQDQAIIVRMQALGILPPSPWDNMAAPAPPSPPGAASPPADAEHATASGPAKSRKTRGKWWMDDADAEWRRATWCSAQDGRSRTIKVRGNKNEGWIELRPPTVAELLRFYDKAQLFDEVKGVVTDPETKHCYDYRFEGGKYLSQRNPNFPESNPRECQVLYCGVEPSETNW